MKNYYPISTTTIFTFIILVFVSLNLEAKIVTGNATNGGGISQNQSICPGSTPMLFQNVTTASGGDENLALEYLWIQTTQNPATGTWTSALGNNTNLTYQPGPIGVTTYFMRCARRAGFVDYIAESNIVTVNVLNTAAAIINGAPSGSIYPGTSVELNATPAAGSTYSWDFDGDGNADCTDQTCSYIYNTVGTFTAMLTVTTSQGCSVTTSVPITVISPTGFGYNDPCNCSNPLNFPTPTILFINDFILINSAPGQTWRLDNVSLGQVYDNNGIALAANTIIPETSTPGQYFLNLWFDSSIGYSATFSNGSSSITTGTTNPCSCINPLPVELISFEVELINDVNVMLKWATASETNNRHFQIQRSDDGVRYENIGLVEGAGSSNDVHHYSFQDEFAKNGRSYYRLKQVDLDGSFEYSPIRQMFIEREGISIYPSPAKEWINIKSFKRLTNDAIIEIVNADAKMIHRYKLAKDESLKSLSLIDFDPGVYFVKIIYSSGDFQTGSFMKE